MCGAAAIRLFSPEFEGKARAQAQKSLHLPDREPAPDRHGRTLNAFEADAMNVGNGAEAV
jgi:hypothetical protein